MPKRKTICTAFLLPLTLTGWSLHCTAQKELSWVGGTVFVFGDVFEAGGTVRHRFLLRNAGEATFHILSARPGCDCTSAVYDTRSVQPGDTAWVEVSYDPAWTGRALPGARSCRDRQSRWLQYLIY